MLVRRNRLLPEPLQTHTHTHTHTEPRTGTRRAQRSCQCCRGAGNGMGGSGVEGERCGGERHSGGAVLYLFVEVGVDELYVEGHRHPRLLLEPVAG